MDKKYVVCWHDSQTGNEGEGSPVDYDWAVWGCDVGSRGCPHVTHWIREATAQEVTAQELQKDALANEQGGFEVPLWMREAILSGELAPVSRGSSVSITLLIGEDKIGKDGRMIQPQKTNWPLIISLVILVVVAMLLAMGILMQWSQLPPPNDIYPAGVRLNQQAPWFADPTPIPPLSPSN